MLRVSEIHHPIVQVDSLKLQQGPAPSSQRSTSPRARSLQTDGGEAMPG